MEIRNRKMIKEYESKELVITNLECASQTC